MTGDSPLRAHADETPARIRDRGRSRCRCSSRCTTSATRSRPSSIACTPRRSEGDHLRRRLLDRRHARDARRAARARATSTSSSCQPENRGKGAAIRTASSTSTGDIVIVQDADLEYDPQDWPVLLEPILDGKADACFGSRFLGGPHRVLYYWHSVGNTCSRLSATCSRT